MELKRRNIGTVIVTSSRRKLVDMITLPTNLVVTIDDVKHGKPDTEPYVKAMQLLGITEPGAIIVVGDALTDMIPARKLGNLAVLIKHGRKFDTDIPNYEIDEVSEILDLLDQP